jgi:hypothetical protein
MLILLLLIAPVEAIPSLQDAEIISKAATLLSTFWLRSRAHAEDEPGEHPLPPLDKPTLLGTPTLPTSGLHIMHVNIRGGIAHFDKWRTVVELCFLKKPDVLVMTETGHNNNPSTLRWLTRTMKPNELNDLDDRSHLSDQFQDTLPYNMYSTEGISTPGQRGGVAVLVHTSLSHRVLGQPVTPSHKRWLFQMVLVRRTQAHSHEEHRSLHHPLGTGEASYV